MNLIELNRSLVQLRLSGMAAVMELPLQAQSESMAPIDLISMLIELPAAASGYWTDAISRRSSVMQTSYSIASTSSSILR